MFSFQIVTLQKSNETAIYKEFQRTYFKFKCPLVKKYNDLGLGFIEAHHIEPLCDLEEEKIPSEKDFILVCSNCHRMLHRTDDMSIEKLKDLIYSIN